MSTPAFKESINIPIAIPAWGLLTLIAGAVFTAGVMFNKMDTLIEGDRENRGQITYIKERQINGLAAISTLQGQMQAHETRLTNIERVTMDARK